MSRSIEGYACDRVICAMRDMFVLRVVVAAIDWLETCIRIHDRSDEQIVIL